MLQTVFFLIIKALETRTWQHFGKWDCGHVWGESDLHEQCKTTWFIATDAEQVKWIKSPVGYQKKLTYVCACAHTHTMELLQGKKEHHNYLTLSSIQINSILRSLLSSCCHSLALFSWACLNHLTLAALWLGFPSPSPTTPLWALWEVVLSGAKEPQEWECLSSNHQQWEHSTNLPDCRILGPTLDYHQIPGGFFCKLKFPNHSLR